MQVLIFRHAERQHAHSDDPPLSDRGFRQSQNLVKLVQESKIPSPTKIICSPKLRAIQTFESLAENLKIPLQVQLELNERQNSENGDVFAKRVKKFLDGLENYSGVIFVVTHLDWIEEALIHITSDVNLNTSNYQAWPPGQSVEFEIADGLWMHAKIRSLP